MCVYYACICTLIISGQGEYRAELQGVRLFCCPRRGQTPETIRQGTPNGDGVHTTQFSDRAILKGLAGLPIGASEFAIAFGITGAAQLRPQAVVEPAPVNRPALHASVQ